MTVNRSTLSTTDAEILDERRDPVTHSHTWSLVNAALRRYRCACGVLGYAPVGRRGILPYKCQHELDDRKHCGAQATHVGHLKTQHRCAEHVDLNQESRP